MLKLFVIPVIEGFYEYVPAKDQEKCKKISRSTDNVVNKKQLPFSIIEKVKTTQ